VRDGDDDLDRGRRLARSLKKEEKNMNGAPRVKINTKIKEWVTTRYCEKIAQNVAHSYFFQI
jgi:hypothetical protein